MDHKAKNQTVKTLKTIWRQTKKQTRTVFRRTVKRAKALWAPLPLRTKWIVRGAGCAAVIALVLLCILPGGNRGGSGEVKDVAAPLPTGGIEIIATPTPEPTPAPTESFDPTLKKGQEGLSVKSLQTRLMELGYLDNDEATEYFGSQTKAAVKLFQRQHDLQQDGIVGPLTLNMIYAEDAQRYAIREGMQGSDVDSVQDQLKSLGYLSKVSGTYDEATVKAVKDFQKRNGLSADGVIGEASLDKLFSSDVKESASKVAAKRKKANIDKVISTAQKQLGKPYILGTSGPKTFDCSGLVYYCLKQAGSNRNRMNAAGYSKVSDWKKITSMSKLQRGDFIFFMNNARTKVGHVGIVIGGGMMIDASSSNGKVVKRSYQTSYWKKMFVCGRRPW